MSSPYTWALIAVALIAAALSYQIPRAWKWIALGGVSFFASTLFLDFTPWTEWHPIFTFMCDFAVCLVIGFVHFHRGGADWELGVFIAFMCSCFASLLMLALKLEPWLYASLLELCNLAALLWIIRTGIIDMAGRHENSRFHHLRAVLHRSRYSVRSDDQASRPPE